MIVFYAELDRQLAPALYAGQLPATLDLDAAAAVAERHRPGSRALIVTPPTATSPVFVVSVSDAEADFGREVYVDPASGRVLGDRVWGQAGWHPMHWVPMVYDLHYRLMLGDTGQWLLGLLALFWLIDHVPATWLSFPSRPSWHRSFRVPLDARGPRLHFNLHRAASLWTLPITLVLAFSSLLLNWSATAEALLDPRAAVRPLDGTPKGAPIGFDAAVGIAGSVDHLDSVMFDAEAGRYQVRLHDPRDLADYGMRLVWIDAVSGKVLGDGHLSEGNAAHVLIEWQFPLHSGKAFGWPGRIVVFGAGLILCLIIATGLLLWFRRYRARRQSRATRVAAR